MHRVAGVAALAHGRYELRTAIFTGAFVLLAWASRSGVTTGIDRAFATELRAIRIPGFDLIAAAVAWIGGPTPTLAIAAVLAAMLFRRRGSWAWIAPLFILLVALVEFAVKQSFSRPPGAREILRAVGGLSAIPSQHRVPFRAATSHAWRFWRVPRPPRCRGSGRRSSSF